MLKIFKPSQVPPGGNFQYTQPETGMKFLAQTPGILIGKVRDHRVANNIPTRKVEQEVIDQFCGRQPDWCEDVDPATGNPTPLEVERRIEAVRRDWQRAGLRVRSDKGYDEVLEICKGCEQYRGESSMRLAIRCNQCGCSAKKLFLADEVCPANPPKWGVEK